MLEHVQAQSERLIEELNWSSEMIDGFIEDANRAIAKSTAVGTQVGDDDPDSSLVVHSAKYSGGFILFGGWTKIYDSKIASGKKGHELYLSFGGLGAGGWSGDCDIELLIGGTFEYNGKRYSTPQYYNKGKSDWESYNSGYAWFHSNVKSFMFMYLPQFAQPIPIFVYYDSSSRRIGLSVPNCSLSCGIGGGSVEVKS